MHRPSGTFPSEDQAVLTFKHVSTIATLLALAAAAKAQPLAGSSTNPRLTKPSHLPQPGAVHAQPAR